MFDSIPWSCQSFQKHSLGGVLKFTGKHLCHSFFFNKVACWGHWSLTIPGKYSHFIPPVSSVIRGIKNGIIGQKATYILVLKIFHIDGTLGTSKTNIKRNVTTELASNYSTQITQYLANLKATRQWNLSATTEIFSSKIMKKTSQGDYLQTSFCFLKNFIWSKWSSA